jgi:hypothetical protein
MKLELITPHNNASNDKHLGVSALAAPKNKNIVGWIKC